MNLGEGFGGSRFRGAGTLAFAPRQTIVPHATMGRSLGKTDPADIILSEGISGVTEGAAVIGGMGLSTLAHGWWKVIGYGLTALGGARILSRLTNDWSAAVVPALYFGFLTTNFLVDRYGKETRRAPAVKA